MPTPSPATDGLQSDTVPIQDEEEAGKEEKEIPEKTDELESDVSEDDDFCQDTVLPNSFSLSGNIEAVKSKVSIGHHVTDNRTVTISQAEKVHQTFYDKRKISVFFSGPSDTPVSISKASEEFRSHLKEHYRTRLSKLTPLPWQAEFSIRLDNLYTTLQLNSPEHCTKFTALEELFLSSEQDLCGTKLLLEGPPGYGKSTLALKISLDWSEGKDYLKKYRFLFLIKLSDLKEDIPTFIANELLPPKLNQHEGALRLLLEEMDSRVMILLDGLNELNRQKRKGIIDLLKGKLLGKATVMVTSRPLPSDDEILSLINKRVMIRGFSDAQLEQFVRSFFTNDKESAQELLDLILNKNGPYRPLAACPLSCLSLCVLFQDGDGKLPSKVTEIYTNLVKWLIGRSVSKKSRISFKHHKLPEKYDRILREFGELCLLKLKNETVEFSKEEIIRKVKADEIIGMGILVTTHTSMTRTRIQKSDCFQLVHNSFIEYFAAYYMRGLIDNLDELENALMLLHELKQESAVLVLKFLMGLLGEKAHLAIDMLHSFDLSDMALFDILRESGATQANVRAISSILDQDFVTVRTTTVELDGWAHILSDPECIIKCLRLQRVSRDIDKTAIESFFDHLAVNQSVTEFSYQSSYGLVLEELDMEILVSRMQKIVNKPNLTELTIRMAGDNISHSIINALSQSLRLMSPTSTLVSLNLHIDLETKELDILCQALNFCGRISKLRLSKISCGPDGYESLSKVLKYGKLESLELSLNLFKTLSAVETEADCGSPEDLRRLLPRLAEKASKVASFGESEDLPEFSSTTTVTSVAAKKFFDGSVLCLEQVVETTPSCSPSHHKSGFHYLLSSLSVSTCILKHLDLSNCYLKKQDLNCLGEAVVLTASLTTLTIVDLESFDMLSPVLQGLSATKTVSEVDFSSKKISINDATLETMIDYLKGSTVVKKINIAGWSGTFNEPSTLMLLSSYFERSALEHLNLSSCKFQIGVAMTERDRKISMSSSISDSSQTNTSKSDSFGSLPESESRFLYEKFKRICERHKKWRNMQRLILDSTEMILVLEEKDDEKILLKGPDLPGFLRFFSSLKELNLSGVKFHKTDALAGMLARKVISLNDDATRRFFFSVSKYFGATLEKLQVGNWDFNWSNSEPTYRAVVKSLKQCPKLRVVLANSVATTTKCDKFTFLNSVARGVPHLSRLSLEWCDISEREADMFAQKLAKHWRGNFLQLQTKFVSDEAVEVITRQLRLSGRFRLESLMQGQVNVLRRQFCMKYF